jgi:hypothetical protein
MFGCRPRFELFVQKSIIGEAIGGASGMDADESKRRRSGYKHFVLGGLTDGRYSNQDIPDLAYRYRDHFSDIITSINDRFVSKHAVDRRAFMPAELKEFERLLRLMLVASVDGCGKLRIAERSERGIIQREIVVSARAPGQVFQTTQQTRQSNRTPPPSLTVAEIQPPQRPRRISNGGSTIPDALRFSSLCECCI